MTFAAAALAILLFAVALKYSGIYTLTLDVIASARAAAAVMRDPALDDDQREVRVQQAAVHLLHLGLGQLAPRRRSLAVLIPHLQAQNAAQNALAVTAALLGKLIGLTLQENRGGGFDPFFRGACVRSKGF